MHTFIQLLLVEDNEVDTWLTQDTLRESRAPVRVHIVADGKEALDFLRKNAPFEQAPTPDVLLLDLNMPVMTGIELLQFLKSSESFKRIPVVVLSTSSHPKDVQAAQQFEAAAYLTKPLSVDQILPILEDLGLLKPEN